MNNKNTKNVAFFDAEFTALTANNRGVQEMIQCALIIYKIELSEDNELIHMSDIPLFVYKTFVRPSYNIVLSKYIKDLTGIKQEDVNNGVDFCDMLDVIYNAVANYDVDHIITWGPDKVLLKNNCNILDCNKIKAKYIYTKIKDISFDLSDLFGYKAIVSQHNMCKLLNITEYGEQHDAYSDAINLSLIWRKSSIPLW